jgi:Tfp pilus assembly protein PilO
MGNKFVPLGIVIIGVLAFVAVRPMSSEVRKTNAKIKANQEQSARTQEKIDKLNELQPKLAVYKEQIKNLKIAMPASQQIPEVLVMVQAIALDAGLSISGFDVQPDSGGGEVGVNMSATGSYDNLSQFTRKLENNLRPIKIKTMNISAADGNSQQVSVSVSFGILYQGKDNSQVVSTN